MDVLSQRLHTWLLTKSTHTSLFPIAICISGVTGLPLYCHPPFPGSHRFPGENMDFPMMVFCIFSSDHTFLFLVIVPFLRALFVCLLTGCLIQPVNAPTASDGPVTYSMFRYLIPWHPIVYGHTLNTMFFLTMWCGILTPSYIRVTIFIMKPFSGFLYL